jgi:acetyl-CoA C-acetyltransferase
MRPVYIIDGARTPFLKARSGPGPFTPVDLAVQCGRPLLLRQPFKPDEFDQVILGCVNVIADEMNPARVAALRLGMGERMPAFTVQINCGSGMQSIDTAYRYIQDGISDLVLAGGTEALSYAPLVYSRGAVEWFGRMFAAKTVWQRIANFFTLRPSFFSPIIGLERGLTDPVVELNMGQTAEVVAKLFNISRLEADEYAVESHLRLAKAQAGNLLADEVEPAFDRAGKVYTLDDGVRPDSTVENRRRFVDYSRFRRRGEETRAETESRHRRQSVVGARSFDHGARAGSVRDRNLEAAKIIAERRGAMGVERGVRGASARVPCRLARR